MSLCSDYDHFFKLYIAVVALVQHFSLQYKYKKILLFEWGFRPQRHSFYVPGNVEFYCRYFRTYRIQSLSRKKWIEFLFFTVIKSFYGLEQRTQRTTFIKVWTLIIRAQLSISLKANRSSSKHKYKGFTFSRWLNGIFSRIKLIFLFVLKYQSLNAAISSRKFSILPSK